MNNENKIKTRLKELKSEWNKGQQQLISLEQKRSDIQHMLFRIDGAIKVLQELLDEQESNNKVETYSRVNSKNSEAKIASAN